MREIQTLKWDFIEYPYIHLPDSKTGARKIPVNDAMQNVLAGIARLPGNPYVITGKLPGEHLTDLQRPWRRIRARAGLEPRLVTGMETGGQRLADPEVEALIRTEAGRLAIEPRTFSDEEIVARVIYPLINEGARVLEEGIAQRAGDIDIVYIYGYGFPAHRGGPMFYADTVGAKAVYDRICEFRDTLRADDWQPAPLLEKLAADNGRFNT